MLPIVVLSLCLCAALSAPSLDPQLDQHWDLWKDWHSKKYHEVGGALLASTVAEKRNCLNEDD